MIKHTIARHSQIGKPERAVKLLKAAWKALELNELRSISQMALCRQLHVSQGTVINWLTGETELHQVEALLRILERLPEPTRHELLNRFLRCYPAMEADRLGHDPASVSRLRKLLEERNGLTLITGGSDGSRTFLVTALGHAFQQLLSREGMIAGIDIHLPDWFVPVLGVSYLGFPCGSRRVREEALRLWPRPNHGAVLVFNGVWSLLPERQKQILGWCENHHVLVADDIPLDPAQVRTTFGKVTAPARIVELCESGEQRIDLKFLML